MSVHVLDPARGHCARVRGGEGDRRKSARQHTAGCEGGRGRPRRRSWRAGAAGGPPTRRAQTRRHPRSAGSAGPRRALPTDGPSGRRAGTATAARARSSAAASSPTSSRAMNVSEACGKRETMYASRMPERPACIKGAGASCRYWTDGSVTAIRTKRQRPRLHSPELAARPRPLDASSHGRARSWSISACAARAQAAGRPDHGRLPRARPLVARRGTESLVRGHRQPAGHPAASGRSDLPGAAAPARLGRPHAHRADRCEPRRVARGGAPDRQDPRTGLDHPAGDGRRDRRARGREQHPRGDRVRGRRGDGRQAREHLREADARGSPRRARPRRRPAARSAQRPSEGARIDEHRGRGAARGPHQPAPERGHRQRPDALDLAGGRGADLAIGRQPAGDPRPRRASRASPSERRPRCCSSCSTGASGTRTKRCPSCRSRYSRACRFNAGSSPACNPTDAWTVAPAVREACRTLLLQLPPTNHEGGRVLMVTSASTGDGKTTSAINLAATLAGLGRARHPARPGPQEGGRGTPAGGAASRCT